MAGLTTSAHPMPLWKHRRMRVRSFAALASVLAMPVLLAPTSANAQLQQMQSTVTAPMFQFEARPRSGGAPRVAQPTGAQGEKQMLVNARELNYDNVNSIVSAVGNVQMYYNGSTVEADRVIYNQVTKRLRAEGNVRLTEPSGNITHGDILELNEDYRDGFVDSLRIETPDDTRFAAARGERSAGRYNVLESGVYTACEACKEDPSKPPLWQVKAARIIHDEGEKMIYFEQGSLEFFGKPVAYFPYFSAPDPTVKRKSGFLMPIYSTDSQNGFSAQIPYFWALAPNYDLTLVPTYFTQQGPMMQAEFRHRLENGAYLIRGAGIKQQDPSEFAGAAGDREWRGVVETSGRFALNQRWIWGWDAALLSDKNFYYDYPLTLFSATDRDPLKIGTIEAVSQVYLTGKGERSFFDMRAIHYYGLSAFDRQKELPVIHPVLDYSNVVAQPIFGGELGYRFNLTSLTREAASFDAITPQGSVLCAPTSADPSQKDCLLRGIPGTYTRASAEATWKRAITDPWGQVFTPFASLRADVASVQIKPEAGVSNFVAPGDSEYARVMPTVGLEYRYPLISAESWGTQIIEPIAQIIVRPNEKLTHRLPNEDSQSLIFDDSNLFAVNKFSGWDRAEGGGRANYGLQYTAQFNQGGFVNMLFGQSYQLFGTNSFAVGDITNTGLDSGLDKRASDYVARVSYQPDSIYTVSSRFRFDEQNFAVRRFELEGRANYDRWQISALYGNYDAQPALGWLTRREGILGSVGVKLTPNWVLQTSARYNLQQAEFDQTSIGVGYIDDCLILAANYMRGYRYYGTETTEIDHRVMIQLSLRTLGDIAFSQSVGGNNGF